MTPVWLYVVLVGLLTSRLGRPVRTGAPFLFLLVFGAGVFWQGWRLWILVLVMVGATAVELAELVHAVLR